MHRFIDWIKSNKLSSFLLAVIIFFIAKSFISNNLRYSSYPSSDAQYSSGLMMNKSISPAFNRGEVDYNEVAPQPQVQNRKVITSSSLSLLVKDVRATMDKIEEQVTLRKGYLVSTNITRPEEGANGYIVIRVPNTEVKPVLEYLRGLSVKVISENISGQDITDEYIDIQARLDILNRNKTTYMAFMDRATNIDEIMKVQQQIFNLQDQIDSLQGQIKYMDGASSTSLITANLSTDELALPYTPDNAWRPALVFKQATRALLGTLYIVGNLSIWVAVYSIIWIPALVVFSVIKKVIKKRASKL